MPTAPVQAAGSPYQTAWTGAGTKTAVVGALAVGDLVVVEGTAEGVQVFPGSPSNSAASPATITWTTLETVGGAGRSAAKGWSGSVTVAGNLTVSIAHADNNWGFIAWVFAAANHGGIGVSVSGNGTGSTPSVTDAWSANSGVFCLNGDFSAVSHGGTRSYLTNLGAATERNYANVDGNYTTEAWEHADSGAGGSQAVGLSTPNQTWSTIAIEVLGTAGAAPGPRPTFNAIPFM